MAAIRWTEEAAIWLEKIYLYIADKSPGGAAKVTKGIFDQVQILSDFPEMGYLYRKTSKGDIRILLYGHYRIAYLVMDKEHIAILGVFHGAMEIERYLD